MRWRNVKDSRTHSEENKVLIPHVLEMLQLRKRYAYKFGLEVWIQSKQNIYKFKEMKGERKTFEITEKLYINPEKTPKTGQSGETAGYETAE